MVSGKLGKIEYQLNAAFQKLRLSVQGSHPHTNITHPQWIMDHSLLKFAKSRLGKLPSNSLILDVGCGNGPYWKINPHLAWEGIDIYETSKTKYLVNEDGSFPIESEKYDFVLCTQVMEHVKDLHKTADEISRVLKPGGLLILNTPYLYPFHGMPEDYFRFTSSGIKALFPNLEIQDFGTLGNFGSSLGTLINNFWSYETSLNWKMRIIGLLMWPFSLVTNLFWNCTSLFLDKLDRTESFPLNVYLIAMKPKGATEIKIRDII